jgi:hypothetical protein
MSLRSPLLDPSPVPVRRKQRKRLVSQCAWCNAVKVDGVYRPAPQKIYDATHGICPPCMQRVMRQAGYEVVD